MGLACSLNAVPDWLLVAPVSVELFRHLDLLIPGVRPWVSQPFPRGQALGQGSSNPILSVDLGGLRQSARYNLLS